ncbi:MAG TPA: hypothetical protein VHC67_10025 [Gaiellaceae bacterium]|nr:hypothetical protein [Gaiellaceae bacterium]
MPGVPKGFPNEISDEELATVVEQFREPFVRHRDAIAPSLSAEILTIALNELTRRREERLTNRVLTISAASFMVAVAAVIVALLK